MTPQGSKQVSLAAAAAKKELLRRAALVQRAMEILARLKARQASLKIGGNGPAKAAATAASSQASLKLALECLLDEKALEALLDELETALRQAENVEPQISSSAWRLHQEVADLVEVPAQLGMGK